MLTLSIFLVSFGIGVSNHLTLILPKSDILMIQPLILAPLSEMYGRTWVCHGYSNSMEYCLHSGIQILHLGNIFSMVLALGCAFAPNTGALLAFRFLSKSIIIQKDDSALTQVHH